MIQRGTLSHARSARWAARRPEQQAEMCSALVIIDVFVVVVFVVVVVVVVVVVIVVVVVSAPRRLSAMCSYTTSVHITCVNLLRERGICT